MDLAGVVAEKFEAFTTGIAGLAPYAAGLSLTIIMFALVMSPAAKEWAQDNKRLAGPVIFGLMAIALVPAFVAALSG